jgi:fatty acid desaturase
MNTFNFKEVSENHKFDNSIKNQIKELCQYNNFNGVMAVSSDYFFIAFAIYLTQVSFWLYPLSVLIIGSRQRALATVLHEAAHKTLAKNRLLNRILGTYFSGYLIFQTWDAYLRSHVFNHHTKLGSPEFDPDLKHYIESGVFERRSKNGFLMRYLVSPFFCANVFSTVRYLLVNRLALRSNGSELVPMLLTFVAFATVGSYLVGWEFILMYWLVPYLTTFQIITWFIELAEHYPLIRGAKDDLHATRNRFSHPIEAFFTAMHAENFHLTHHLFPGVPFWKLKRAHRILLEDPAYAKINAGFGGIFFSGNYACSKWEKLVFQNAEYEN